MEGISKTLHAMTRSTKRKATAYWQLVGKHQHDWHNLCSGIDEKGNCIFDEDCCIICLARRPHKNY